MVGLEALAAAFDALPVAAYLVDGDGRILAANAQGRARVGAGPSQAAVAPVPSMPGLYVLVITPAHDPKALLAAASLLWHLTSREREVLDPLVRGRSNKEISNSLGCSESTVGVHVKHVTHKAGTDRRGLVARFWSQGVGFGNDPFPEEDGSNNEVKIAGTRLPFARLVRCAAVGAPRRARRAGGIR